MASSNRNACSRFAKPPIWVLHPLRIIVCGCCGYLAYKEYEIEQKASFWVLVLGAISLLFNPLIPIHLGRDVWAIIDPSVALILSVHIRTEFRKRRQITKMK